VNLTTARPFQLRILGNYSVIGDFASEMKKKLKGRSELTDVACLPNMKRPQSLTRAQLHRHLKKLGAQQRSCRSRPNMKFWHWNINLFMDRSSKVAHAVNCRCW